MTDPLSAAGLEHFGEVAARHVAPDKIPGLVALVARRDQVHVEALGSLAIGGAGVEADSLYRIASTTKVVTGVTAMSLVDEGLLGLDERIDKWLPELTERRVLARPDGPLSETVPATAPITVRQLMSFTFGFGMVLEMFMSPEPWPVVRAADELGLGTFGPPDPTAQPDADAWLANLGSLPLIAQPGERWMYNTGASVLGILVSRAAGAPLGDVMRERVLEPLGMRDTAFWTTETQRLATAYGLTPEGLAVWDAPDGKWSRPPAFCDGAAGLVSTVGDLLALGRMFLRAGEPVLSPAAAAEMTRDQLRPGQMDATTAAFLHGRSWGCCQSVVTDGPRTGAFGWDGGLGTSFLVDPRRDLVVVVLTQRVWETATPPAVHDELQDAAYEAVLDDSPGALT
jgi:CubicO group peptidase (beta-lactamase class C family)